MIHKQPTERIKRISYNLLLSPKEHNKLKELAEANGLSMAGCLRLLIIEAYKYLGSREHTI